MTRGEKSDVRTTEASNSNDEEARSLLSGPSATIENDDEDLSVHSGTLDEASKAQNHSATKLQSSLSQPSPNGQPRTPRTPHRVRFDLEDDELSERHSQTVPRDTWVDEEDYFGDGASPSRSSTGQLAPLLTDIEAPSVTVATSNLDFFPEDHLESARPKSGLRSAFMNMANSIIGAGIIGQPYAFRQAGLTMGIILLVGLTIAVDWTIRLIVVNSKLSGADSFQATVEFCFGRPGMIAISLAQWAFAFGGMIAFCIIVGDTIPQVLSGLFPSLRDMPFLWLLTNRYAVIILFVLGVSYPLSLYRDIAKVKLLNSLIYRPWYH